MYPETITIDSQITLSAAVSLLQKVRLQETQVRAQIEADLAEQLKEYQARLVIKAGRRTLTLEEYGKEIEHQILAYTRDHKEDLFSKGKTLKFPGGEVAARAVPDALTLDKRATEDAIQKRYKIAALLLTIFEAQPHLRHLIEFKIHISHKKILDAVKSGALTPHVLKALGITVEADKEDNITVKVAA